MSLTTDTQSHSVGRHLQFLARVVGAVALAILGFAGVPLAPAANIAWVSDANDPAVGFFPPGSGYTDSGFVTLLQNAGHNVVRYNPPAAQGTLLTPIELADLHTNDLVIIGRNVNSAIFQTGQGNQWNVDIVKPLVDLSAFHARNSRLGWFAANEGADNTPTVLAPVNGGDPVTDYLFGGVVMNGTNTALPYDETMDRNSTPIPSDPVAGGTVYARGTYAQENSTVTPPPTTTANFIVGFPAGTAVRAGVDILGGYRMFFAAGSRESATAPNTIQLYASRENLTPTGEDIFLRAIEVALNNGAAPVTNTGPAAIISQPVSPTVLQGASATFSITVTGEAPRTVQWQRDDGTGTFIDIPDTLSEFAKSAYTISATNLEDSGARFQVVVSNALGVETSDVVTLTVNPDGAAPVLLSAASLDGLGATVCFDELLDPTPASEPGNFLINAGAEPDILSATLRPDGRSIYLELVQPISGSFSIDASFITDHFGNSPASNPTSVVATNFGLIGVDVGTQDPPGTNNVCDPERIEVTGGGLDAASTIDSMRLVYKTVTGDFDARVRVVSITGTPDHLESTAKALLVARESLAADAAAVNVFATPPPPGDNSISSTTRPTTGAATNNIGATVQASSNTWLRIQREGDVFTTYSSTNGTDWVPFGSVTTTLPAAVEVGLGAVSHRNGRLATATFSNFRIDTGAVPPAPVFINPVYNAGVFSASFQTQNGVNYTVQYKDDLNAATWSSLPTVTGDGTLKSFTDPGPVSATGGRFYRLLIP